MIWKRLHRGLLPLVGVLLLMAGCASSVAQVQAHTFPSVWPTVLNRTLPPLLPAHRSGPSLQVETLQLDIGEPQEAPSESGPATAEVLTDLLVKTLQASGVEASRQMEAPDYRLVSVVPTLIFSRQSGRPAKVLYSAELACQLIDSDGRILWQRNLKQSFDRKVLVGMMSRIPEAWREDEQILIEKCLLPVYRRMVQVIKTSLEENL